MRKSNTRKLLSLLAIVTLVGSLLAGCNNGNGGNNGNNEKTNASSETSNSGTTANNAEEPAKSDELPMTNGKYDPPIEITTVRQVGPDQKFKNGETLDNNVFTKWLKDRLGIGIKTLWTTPTTNDAYKTKLMLSLSANEPLPDYLVVPADIAHTLIDSGKFQPVNELFDKYASDKWKTAMAETDNVWLPYMRDGKAYAIPMIESSLLHDDVMWIRQDWLDKLGLKAPTNMDELETVMDAFVNKDPDGNGKKDTIAVTAAAKNVKYNYITWLGLNPVFGAYNSFMSIWHKNDKGEIVYGSTTPETKTAIGKVKEWIDKGYLHKEYGIHDEVKAIELFNSGQAGIAFSTQWAYSWPFNEVEKNTPGAKVTPYPLPSGPNGQIGQIGNGLNHWLVLLINKEMKHPEVLFTYQNYLYDTYEDPAKGSEFEFGFAKGYDYDFVDDKLVTADNEIPGGRAMPPFLFMAPVTPSKQIKTLAELADGKTPSTPYEEKLAAAPEQSKLSAKYIYEQKEHTVNNLFTGAMTETMKEKQENLDKMEAEMFSKIIYGKEPLDYFDTWVADWKKAGGDQITKEITEWYNAATVK
ncbi:extracellular solute-binding protein [Paenibacillus silvisoli]|uniref:extracellular solute-binding protein n=1 Tax=Paenibacillus silvisoli TaxID=3110539 RepID=UPI002805AAB5|nr:extracellular solute-binding protein [Paenibacillus silvisoli]